MTTLRLAVTVSRGAVSDIASRLGVTEAEALRLIRDEYEDLLGNVGVVVERDGYLHLEEGRGE